MFPLHLDSSELLLSLPPEALPGAIRSLTTWRLQEPRPALPAVSVLLRKAEADEPRAACARRIRWISRGYHDELRITEDDEKTFPGQHAHALGPSHLRRGSHVCTSNSTPTINPIPTAHKAIPTTTNARSTTHNARSRAITHKPTPTPMSTKNPKSESKSRPVTKSKAPVDSENIPPPRRRPAAGKSRIPAPASRTRIFASHNA